MPSATPAIDSRGPNSANDSAADYVRIFDSTLRDGEQAPGCSMAAHEKLAIAHQLVRLGVDIIEAGFPAASSGDWCAVHAIASEVGADGDAPVIAALARATEADIDACWTALQDARRPRIHTFLATSDIHLEHKLRMTRPAVLAAVSRMVAYARARCIDVEFSPEDAGRSDPTFLYEVLHAAVESGATTLNIPDTVGYTTPEEYGALIRGIVDHVPGAGGNAVLSTHCHDDLGLAVANSLAGVRGGARQIECAINGLGERAGNASLEECVMALVTRQATYGVRTGVRTQELVPTSRLVERTTGVPVPPNKAIVGANAFAHAAGIHQHGVIANPLTYEIMDAAMVGADGSTLVLGKHSGRHAVQQHLLAMGVELSKEQLTEVFTRFKTLADHHKVVCPADLLSLVRACGQTAADWPAVTTPAR